MVLAFWILGWVMWNGIAFFILRWLSKKFDENCSISNAHASQAAAVICLFASYIIGFTAILAAISNVESWKE